MCLNRSFCRLLILLLIVTPALFVRSWSQSPNRSTPGRDALDSARVHETTLEGIHALYNFRFQEAEQTFDAVIQMAQADPRSHFFKAMIYHYRYSFLRQRGDFDKFIELSEKVESVAEDVLKRDKKNSNAMFFLGGICIYRGYLRSQEGQRWKAVWDGRKGYSYLEDALEANPNNVDAEMGLGLFNYMVSQIPAGLRWIVKLIGYGGDRAKGLEQLERAATNGIYGRNEARLWLSQFLSQEGQYEKSLQLLDQLASAYPSNPFYELHRGNILLLRLRRADEAYASYQKVLSIDNPEAERFTNEAHYQLGHIYRFKNQFPEAIQAYSTYAAFKNADTSLQHRARYLIGLCYELMGDRAKALPYYEQALGVSEAQERLKTPLTAEDIEVRKIGNAFNAGEYEQVVQASSEFLKKPNLTDDQRGRALYTLGQAYAEKQDYTQALDQFDKVLKVRPQSDTWLPPYAHYHRGLVYLKMGKNDLAKRDFEKVTTFKNYTGERWMRTRAKRELTQLE